MFSELKAYQHQLIGEPQEQLMKLKIKDNVDHVGHFLPSSDLKDYKQLKTEN